jgi:hypothetical protein
LNAGSRSVKYQSIVWGWLGVGVLEMLNANGTVNAHEAMAAATGADTGRAS